MNMINKLRSARGFTLVELLIVIAVIGILAIAVLAALDPIEQLRKSRDTGRLADARELLNAYTRYYSSYQCYPNERTGTTCNNSAFLTVIMQPSNTDLSAMISTGELKPQFTGKTTVVNRQLWATQDTQDQITVCFRPESKSAQGGSMGDILTADGTAAGSGCTTANYNGSTITTCNICVR